MGWLQKLVETYDKCAGAEQFDTNPLAPISHTPKQAHIEIALDGQGNFQNARILQKESTLIPSSENSAGRTSTAIRPHPLCDKIQYVASDYPLYGGMKPSLYSEYVEQLSSWCASPFTNLKAQAILDYVRQGTVVRDLIDAKLLFVGDDKKLLTEWPFATSKPDIFRLLSAANFDQGDAFIRWNVEIPGDPRRTFAYYRGDDSTRPTLVSGDADLQSAWIGFNSSRSKSSGLCMVSGQGNAALAGNHPKGLRYPGDGAKLISANDKAGFTFRGRFTDDDGNQGLSIGYEASQKAHLALRWLIERQAYRNGDQCVLSWSASGDEIPNPFGDTSSFLELPGAPNALVYQGDAGQSYSLALKSKIAGYRSILSPDASIIVIALDSATPGRLSVTFYREFSGAEFLDRIETWHEGFAWHQLSKHGKFVGAPSPANIIEAVYGPRVDDRLRKASVERLLPCIIDSQVLPRDFLEQAFRRTCARVGLSTWDWERTLGVACALFRGCQSQLRRGLFDMFLEQDRNSRDYLFGRLLAYGEHIEERGIWLSGEKRDTHAAKLMQRFADHPSSTWMQIEKLLIPYKSRLRARSPGYLHALEQQVDDIFKKFQDNDFTKDAKLTAEFLLGYHCQRACFHAPKTVNVDTHELFDQSSTEEP